MNKTIGLIKSAALMSLFLLTVFSNYVSAEIDNPYDLVTDSNLNSSWSAIESYWLSGEAGHFTGVNDVDIKHLIFKHSDEIGAVVISSGRTETYLKYKELIYNLGRSGYTVYIHDHRGQGFSGRMTKDLQKGHVWDFNNYVTDLKTFYDLSVAPNKHEKLYLLGHSMGGGIATLYIEKYQSDFRAAVLSSPMHQPETGIPNAVVCAGANLTTSIRDIFIFLFDWEPRYAIAQGPYKKKPFTVNDPYTMTHNQQRYEAIQSLYDKNDEVKIGGITSHWLANACSASEQLLENTASIRTPVLVFQAEEDIAVTVAGQKTFCENLALAGEIRCEGGQPDVIRGAYHELFIESDEYRIPVLTKTLQFFEKYSQSTTEH